MDATRYKLRAASMKTVIVLTLFTLCSSDRDFTVCTPPVQVGTGPPKPTLPQQYQVRIECNIVDQHASTTITENYDNVNNQGEITQVSAGTTFKGYFDYNTNEFLSVLPDSSLCTVQDLADSASNFIFGYSSQYHGQGQIFSASGALHFTSGSPEVYLKKDTIRGIPVDAWYSCQYWKDLDATMNVTWYFSDLNNWDLNIASQSAPVAAHVIGRVHNGDDSRAFEHWYHLYNFIPSVDQQAFEVPDGIVCPHRINTKPVPPLSSSFSQIGEVINNELTYISEKYDKLQKIAAYSYKPNSEIGTDYGVNRMLEINDFTYGVAYIIDTLLGNCSVTQLDHGNFLYQHKAGSKSQVRMLSPKEYFLMNNMVDSYTYLGKRMRRGILCDAWTGVYKDVALFGANLTVEWYFMSSNWTSWTDVNPLFPGAGVPVAMVSYVPEGKKNKNMAVYEFNVFNFDRADPNVLEYDISSCYQDLNRRKFHVSIPGEFDDYIYHHMEIFRYSFLSTVAGLCNISPLRVANINVDLDEDIHLTFEMLDVTPVMGDNSAPQVLLKDAADIFIDTVLNGNFKIVWNVYVAGGLQAPNITIDSTSLKEMDYETKQFGYTGAIGFGPGSMAGCAFAMAIIGGTMGAGTSFFCFQ